MSIRQYVVSDPSTVIYKQSYSDINGTPQLSGSNRWKTLKLELTNWSTTTAQTDTTKWTILQTLKPTFDHSIKSKVKTHNILIPTTALIRIGTLIYTTNKPSETTVQM